jgi:hypothetical protein
VSCYEAMAQFCVKTAQDKTLFIGVLIPNCRQQRS